ncbi:shikimate kinase [Caloramator sp. Dgby_cultured_2]|nr:shikimate kinase [Caloramator sp. Dgby_cultured_2]WDU84289.1 shikimate kinase [Caloramator sp. Dgby_cultured_2]
MKNISLIGMPGCGKTTIGRILAEGLGYYFVDLDEYIENKSGMRIDYIFENFGEKFFRKLESESLKEIIAGSKK